VERQFDLDSACAFCQLQRRLLAHVIYEDDRLYVMLDRQGLTFGHCMVILKRHAPRIYEMEGSEYRYLLEVSRRLARVMQDRLTPTAVAYVVHGAGFKDTRTYISCR
jgi:histidine triad (HIT) family protein